jgi:hypothetical protein
MQVLAICDLVKLFRFLCSHQFTVKMMVGVCPHACVWETPELSGLHRRCEELRAIPHLHFENIRRQFRRTPPRLWRVGIRVYGVVSHIHGVGPTGVFIDMQDLGFRQLHVYDESSVSSPRPYNQNSLQEKCPQ